MLQFDFLEKSLGIVSPPHLVYDVSIEIFFILHCFNWPNLIAWSSLRHKILGIMYITIVCFPSCNVMNFEINLIFQIKPFLYMSKKSRQKFKCLENEKGFWDELKRIFHHFWETFSCQKLSQTRECLFKGCLKKFRDNIGHFFYNFCWNVITLTFSSNL